MRRKMFGAILLPLPFAALPVIVVLIGAVFGPKSSEQLVTRDAPTAITFQERVLTDSYDEPTGLAPGDLGVLICRGVVGRLPLCWVLRSP